MATPIAQDDDLTTSWTGIRRFDLFADNGNGIDNDPDGDRISVSRVENMVSSVGKSLVLDSGARFQVQRDGTLIFNPNGAYDDLDRGESTTETLSYTIRDPGGSIDHASVEVTVSAPEAPASAEGVYFQTEDPDEDNNPDPDPNAPRYLWQIDADGDVVPITDADTGRQLVDRYSPEVRQVGESAFLWKTGSPTSLMRADGSGEAETVRGADGEGLSVVATTSDEDFHRSAEPTAVGDSLYFWARTSDGVSLWSVGQNGDAEQVEGVTPGAADAGRGPLVSANGYLYFTVGNEDDRQLYRIGPNGEAENIQDLLPDSASDLDLIHPEEGESDSVFLSYNTTGTGGVDHFFELKSDDTLTRLTERADHPSNYNVNYLTFDDDLFEAVQTDTSFSYMVSNVSTGSDSFLAGGSYAVTEDAIYFGRPTGEGRTGQPLEPARYNPDGTVEDLADLSSDGANNVVSQFAEVDDDIYFKFSPSQELPSLYKVETDGPGLPDVSEVATLGRPRAGQADFDGQLYFPNWDETSGEEPWRTNADGGIERVADINPGPDDSDPRFLGSVEFDEPPVADDPLIA
ncbi:Ig-like domain-containing protein [Marinivivus vitaminiproducens]|uniref:Ig-like domain-containing protein n=1 Tax=Marinivivus vitaminiproducens TaxID=3035935 RepID=UPI00279DCC92|nr:Ig-like domain-containing protein [Geminicoccaceae bacterium SCSIO 64248]